MPVPIDRTPGKPPHWLYGVVRAFDSRLQRDPKTTLALVFGGAACLALVVVLAIGAAVWNLAPDDDALTSSPEFGRPEEEVDVAGAQAPADSSRLVYGKRTSPASGRDTRATFQIAEARTRAGARGPRTWRDEEGPGAGGGRGARGDAGAPGAGGSRGRLKPAAGLAGGGGAASAGAQPASASPLSLGGPAAAGAAAGGGIFSAQAWKRKIQALGRLFAAPVGGRPGPRQALKTGASGRAGSQPGGGATASSTGFGAAAPSAPVSGRGATVAPGGPIAPNAPATTGGATGQLTTGGGTPPPSGTGGPGPGPLTPPQIAELTALRGRLTRLLASIQSGINGPGLEALTDALTGGRADLALARTRVVAVRDLARAVRQEFQAGVGAVPEAARAVQLFDEFLRGLGGPDGVLAGFDRTLAQSDEARTCLRETDRTKLLACVKGPAMDAVVAGPRQRNAELGGVYDLLEKDPSGLDLARELRQRHHHQPPTHPGRIALDKWTAFITQAKRHVAAAGRLAGIVLAIGLDLSVPTTRGYLDVRAATGNGATIVTAIAQAVDANKRTLDSIIERYKTFGWVLPPGATDLGDAQQGLGAAKIGFGPIAGIADIPWQQLTPLQTNEKARYGTEGVAGALGASVALERIIAAVDVALGRAGRQP